MTFLAFLGIYLGIFLPKLLHTNGFLIGNAGVDYYAEVHTTQLNSYCHTLGMPFTIYGILLWLPMLFKLHWKRYIDIQKILYYMYMTHYIIMDVKIGLLIAFIYWYPLQYSIKKIEYTFQHIKNKSIKCVNEYGYLRLVVFIEGFMISMIALLLQEVIGHWLSGDPQSRIEAIPNAIIYAIYYSVYHIFT